MLLVIWPLAKDGTLVSRVTVRPTNIRFSVTLTIRIIGPNAEFLMQMTNEVFDMLCLTLPVLGRATRFSPGVTARTNRNSLAKDFFNLIFLDI